MAFWYVHHASHFHSLTAVCTIISSCHQQLCFWCGEIYVCCCPEHVMLKTIQCLASDLGGLSGPQLVVSVCHTWWSQCATLGGQSVTCVLCCTKGVRYSLHCTQWADPSAPWHLHGIEWEVAKPVALLGKQCCWFNLNTWSAVQVGTGFQTPDLGGFRVDKLPFGIFTAFSLVQLFTK